MMAIIENPYLGIKFKVFESYLFLVKVVVWKVNFVL